jgi:hypothetical protein
MRFIHSAEVTLTDSLRKNASDSNKINRRESFLAQEKICGEFGARSIWNTVTVECFSADSDFASLADAAQRLGRGCVFRPLA